MADNWRPVVNAVLYMSQFSTALDEAEAQRVSAALLEKPLGNLTPEQEYRALADALESGQELDTVVKVKHAPAEVRSFLSRVVAELDAMRPWPLPPLREIPITQWSNSVSVGPIAQIAVGWPAIEGRVGKTFKRLENGQGLLVALRSGSELALIWPSQSGKAATDVFSLGQERTASAIAQELISATSLNADEISIS
ncbi:hypothetical protein [Nocardia shimofusensis]|uniref:hypothetical protein n=1 Tax=Nocardia shimofusensis TaxID=228596 RepID=UPI0012ECD67F|nr:hypothetical protein [Nocardia shimofusensis]